MVSSENVDQISGPVRLERPATGGAVGRLDDGRVVFVRHGLPEEVVRVAITESTSKFSRGDAVERHLVACDLPAGATADGVRAGKQSSLFRRGLAVLDRRALAEIDREIR